MSALKYRDRIRIEARGPSKDPDYGTPLPVSWVLVAEVWAEIVDALPSRSEAVKNGLRLATDSARIRIRMRPGITSAMRVVELTGRRRTFQIVGGPAVLIGNTDMEFSVEGYSS